MKSNGLLILHCSYHKCLTKYFARVFESIYNINFLGIENYRHFNSYINEFYSSLDNYKALSVNNHSIDFDRIPRDYRLTRFVRDPRDLIVSGYFYHKRGAEDWCKIKAPTKADWECVNGNIPSQMKPHESYFDYLNRVPIEAGLYAEIEFRKYHFASMTKWPTDNNKIMLIKYENLLGNEEQTFENIFDFFELSLFKKRIGLRTASRLKAGTKFQKKSHLGEHMRTPVSGQWKSIFSNNVKEKFERDHGDLIEYFGYDN